jgi:pimeloyl-ACP methyl ester carboxylesterase
MTNVVPPSQHEENKIPEYLYKVISTEQWQKSQSQKTMDLSTDDAPFIHLAQEDQLERIIIKYWSHSAECVIVTIRTNTLPGRLAFETNPGGSNKYYHLYDGFIPMSSVVGVTRKTFSFYSSMYVHHKRLKLYCESIGDRSKPPVLLISGAGAHAHFWTDPFCTALAQGGYWVIRFDHRDTGLSSAVNFDSHPYSLTDLAEDVIAIMDAFHITQAHVVGHSMGGTIAQLLRLFHPSCLLSCTSISAPLIGTAAAVSEETMAALLENTPSQNFEESLAGFMRSWKMLNGALPLDEEMATEYTKELYTRSIHPVGVAWNHIRCQQHTPPLPSPLPTSVPELFLHGEHDCLIPQPHASPHTQTIPRMGHMMFHTGVQQQIAQLLLSHFAKAEMKSESSERATSGTRLF